MVMDGAFESFQR